jgi:YHS domain-containing protein
MVRFILILVLILVVARALWRILDGVIDGLGRGSRPPVTPQNGVLMERDPVCGTFIVRDRAVSLAVSQERLYFCSARCRDKYRGGAHGRTA